MTPMTMSLSGSPGQPASLYQDKNFHKLLSSKAASLYDNPLFSNVTVITKESTFNGHKILFSIRSDDWGAGPGNLVNTNVLNWKHLDENISRKLLEWVYLGTPLINDLDTDEESLEILKVARSLGLTEMKLKCQIKLLTSSSKLKPPSKKAKRPQKKIKYLYSVLKPRRDSSLIDHHYAREAKIDHNYIREAKIRIP